MVIVLGGGIAGLSAAYHLKLNGKDAVVYEKNDSCGGLCDSFNVDGFSFDNAVHLSFTKNEYVKELFENSAEFFTHHPDPLCLNDGRFIKHPIQSNLYKLDIDDRVAVIDDFVKVMNKDEMPADYEQWLKLSYGDYFAEKFPMEYTKKYWANDAKELTTSWVGERMRRPSLKEMLIGAMTEDTGNKYYADEMRYPQKGGYKSFLKHMLQHCKVKTGYEAISIDVKNKKVSFSNGEEQHYDEIISTLPLPVLVNLLKDVPTEIKDAASTLSCTSMALVSIGLDVPSVMDNLWTYIYDKEILPARINSPSRKSKYNTPEGSSSLQFETYFTDLKPLNMSIENLGEHCLDVLHSIFNVNKNSVSAFDVRTQKYANVIFDKKRENSVKTVHEYLNKIEVFYCGRFGMWDYYWSDDSLLSGKDCAEKIKS